MAGGPTGDGVQPADMGDERSQYGVRMTGPSVAKSHIEEASKRLARPIRETPVMTIDGVDFGIDGSVSLKLEYLQHSGTFKARGAMNFMLSTEIGEAGVTAASGGNHGAAVAWAAAQLGHRASIFVPTISAPAKVARLRSYGAEVFQVGEVYAESLEACHEHQEKTGATGIHAYEAPAVFAGAGTTGLEFERQIHAAGRSPMDSVLVACGGGGLVGGIATWLGDRASIVACETFGTPAYSEAKAAGKPVDVEIEGIAADALGASSIGWLAFDALSAADAESVLVDDVAVTEARQLLWERYRIVVEPSAAVPIAAVTSGAWMPEPGQHTGIVVCGANTSFDNIEPAR